MTRNKYRTGNISIDLKEAPNTTINVDNSIKVSQINNDAKPRYENKTIWDTKTKPIVSFVLSLIAIMADLLGILSFLQSGSAFENAYDFVINLILFTVPILMFTLFISLNLINREYIKFLGGISFLKRNKRIIVVKIKGICPICSGQLDVAQSGNYAYCLRNSKHKFDFDYTQI